MAKAHPHLLVCELAGWKRENKDEAPITSDEGDCQSRKMTQNARTNSSSRGGNLKPMFSGSVKRKAVSTNFKFGRINKTALQINTTIPQLMKFSNYLRCG